jgi:hypothetical protein
VLKLAISPFARKFTEIGGNIAIVKKNSGLLINNLGIAVYLCHFLWT